MTPPAEQPPWHETLQRLQDRVGARALLAAMLISLAVVILASFIRIPKAEFGLSAKVDSLTLETSAPFELEDLTTQSVDIAGIHSSRWSAEPGVATPAVSGLRVEAAAGVVTLSRLRVPAGWSLMVEVEASGRQRILANPGPAAKPGAPATLAVAVPKNARIRVVDTDNAPRQRTSEADEEVFLSLGRIDASVRLPAGRQEFARRLRVSALALLRREIAGAGAADAELSEVGSIRSGSLWIAHVAGPPQDLGLLDRITVSGINRGAASLALNADLWEVSARGEARDITNRPGDASDSLKPDLLTVVRDYGVLKVCVAVISFLAGIKISSRGKAARP